MWIGEQSWPSPWWKQTLISGGAAFSILYRSDIERKSGRWDQRDLRIDAFG